MSSRRVNHHRWVRPRNVILAVALLMIGLVSYLLIWSMTVRPNPTVDYASQLTALSADSQPPGENGWPELVKAAELWHQIEQSLLPAAEPGKPNPAIDFEVLVQNDASIDKVQLAVEALQRLRVSGLIDHWAAAAKCPNAVREIDIEKGKPMLFARFSEMGQFRSMAPARIADMRLLLQQGEYAQAIAAFDQLMFLAWSLTHQATVIDHLIGYAVARSTLTELRCALVERLLDETTMNDCMAILDRRTPLGSLSQAMEGERLFNLDVIQHTHSDSGWGGGTLLPSELRRLGLADWQMPPVGDGRIIRGWRNITGLALASRSETVACANQFFERMISRTEMPRHARRDDSFDDGSFIPSLNWRFMLLRTLLPAIGHVSYSQDDIRCEVEGTRLLLAVELHALRTGQYPESLDELVPGELESIAADPISPLGFRYTTLIHNRPYLLYTVGADGRDDLGTRAPQPRDALDFNRGAGFDFVFNSQQSVATPATSQPISP